jgi:5,10-methylenetetrahydrofolate reductase
MSKLSDALAAGKFVVTVELDPPRGADLDPLGELAGRLSGKADAVVVSDNRGAIARMSPVMACRHLIANGGPEVIMTLTCRDRNRLGLTSELLAAAAAGVENLLVVSGDFVTLGDQPGSRPVYDLDSVQALLLASALAQGQDLAGELSGPAPFYLGATLAPDASLLGLQTMKFMKKSKAGAAFFITKPIRDASGLEALAQQAGAGEAKIIAGLELEADQEPSGAAELAQALKAGGIAAGVHLACPDNQQRLPELVGQLGL